MIPNRDEPRESRITMSTEIIEQAKQFRDRFAKVHDEIGKVIVGHAEIVHGVLTCLFVGGHACSKAFPGWARRSWCARWREVLDLDFSRIQFTPDLMPSDIIGTNIITERTNGHGVSRSRPGPIFAQIVLADEINRATPKTQSALLEAMQEHSGHHRRHDPQARGAVLRHGDAEPDRAGRNVSAARSPARPLLLQVDRPLFSRATIRISSSIARRGTSWPQAEKIMDGVEIVRWQGFIREVLVAPPVQDYAIRLLLASHPQNEFASEVTNRYIRCGAPPRSPGVDPRIQGAGVVEWAL